MPQLKSPLRYPGGKSKALDRILPHFPAAIGEYREPFVGGGSVLLAVKQRWGCQIEQYWINDLNGDLCCFWQSAKAESNALADAVERIKQTCADGRALFHQLTRKDLQLSSFERAVRFFVLNRITFSGTVDSGGYSQQAFEQRFTDSAIDRLRHLSVHLSSVHITNGDYEDLLFKSGDNVFIFLDPPYFTATKSKLYGVKGDLHTAFDHDRFAQNMRQCPHKWLITYDDSPQIRKSFSFAHITQWTLQYGMNNYKQESAALGQELLIRNYEIRNYW